MRSELLEALLAARAAGRPEVLLTPLAPRTGSFAQRLWRAQDALPAELHAAAREALRADRAHTLPTAEGEIFVQPFNPPLRLVIVGAVHIAQALAACARLAGYRVTVVDPRAAFASAARFPGTELLDEWPDAALSRLAPDARTAIVTLSHDPKLDDPALRAALQGEAFYIGALGSRRTHEKRLARLSQAGVGEAGLRRIHGPAGLPIGARTPAEIAIAVLAQMTAVLRDARDTGTSRA